MSIHFNPSTQSTQVGEIDKTTNPEKPQSKSGVYPNPKPATKAADHPSKNSISNSHGFFKNRTAMKANLGKTIQNKHVKFMDNVKANREVYNEKVAAAGGDKKAIKDAKQERRKANWNAFKNSFKHVFHKGGSDKAKKSQKLAQESQMAAENAVHISQSQDQILARMQKMGGQRMLPPQ